MGTLWSKEPQNLYNPQQIKPPINSSSYLLGKNTSVLHEETPVQLDNHFDHNRLHFIPDSERLWDSPLPLRLPKFNRPLSPPPLRLEYLDKMPTQQKYKCDQCGMVFPSDDSLFRHKTRFCIGVKDSGIGRQPVYSDDEEIETKRSTGRRTIQHQSPMEKKRDEVDDWKRQRSILQSVEDMEDRLLIDTQRTLKLANNIKKQDSIYNEIVLDYERLQTQERDVLRQMYKLQPETTTKSKPTNYLSDNQFEELQRKNLRLERERRIIQQKLEELISTNYQPSTMSTYEPYRFLRDMKEQQELNEKALNFLRGRAIYSDSDVPSLPYVNTRYSRLRRTGGDNIRSFRNNYLHSGGHDANVIAHYSDIENRLRAYEDYPWRRASPEPLKQSRYQQHNRHVNSTTDRPVNLTTERLKLANEENQRLQTELDRMQRKFQTLHTRTKELELSVATNGLSKSTDNLSTRTDFNNNNHDQFDQRQIIDKRLTPRASPAMSLLNSNINRLQDPLAPQAYDPIGGFVIFFDFIANLPSTTEHCCLVTCLYHPKSGLGEPSQLEPFKCDQYLDGKKGQRMSVALIASKQPVPRCPPQQALTVVIEIQTSTNKQPTDEELQTNAWIKLPLFDNKNRLLSGRWKVPLKALPIHHTDSLAVIDTLPTFEQAELYYRLVNSQDEDDQSNAPLSPSFRDLYIYPLQFRLILASEHK